MAGRFSIQPLGGSDRHDPWFRIGTLDIGSAAVAGLLCIVGLVVWAVAPVVAAALILDPSAVLHGQAWRLVTWPVPNPPSLWTAIDIAILWYFGLQLERTVGRYRMAFFLGALAFLVGLLGVVLGSVLFGTGGAYAGVAEISVIVLLTFIAEHPNVRFLFNIPGWLVGLVIVGIQMLQYVAGRDGLGLLLFVGGLGVAAVLAKAIGLLSEVEWLPTLRLPRPHRRPRAPRAKRSRAPKGRTVVPGPWGSSAEKDQAEFDALLDKISASGMASLTPGEVRRLHALRDKLRGR